MGGPTLMQKLLSQPSTSYSQGHAQHRQSLYETTQYSQRAGSSVRSGRSSVYSCTTPDLRSGASSPVPGASRPQSISALSDRSLASFASSARDTPGGWVNGQWEWAAYGGRGGLTRGPASIHPSELASELGVRTRSQRRRTTTSDAGSDFGDNQSFRSARTSRSYSSVKSSASELGNTARWTHASPSLQMGALRKPSKSSKLSSLVTGTAEPSRKYSSLSPMPSLISPASSSAKPRPRRERVSRSFSTDSPMSEVPSLTSSRSSSRDSPPLTPVNTAYDSSYLSVDPAHAKQKRAKRSENAFLTVEQAKPKPKRKSKSTTVEHPLENTVTVCEIRADENDNAQDPTGTVAERQSEPVASAASAGHESDEAKTTVFNDGAASASDSGSDSESDSDSAISDEDAPENPQVPRISLTRTDSDQSATGIKGDIDVLTANSPVKQRRSSSHQTNKVVGPAYPPVTMEIVKSSPAKKQRSTKHKSKASSIARTAEGDVGEPGTSASSGSAAAQDPQWLKRIKALGGPIDPLLKDVPVTRKRTKEPQLHWTVQQYEEQQQQQQQQVRPIHRPSSLGNLRRPKWDALEPMPEQDEREESVVSKASKQAAAEDTLEPALPALTEHRLSEDSAVSMPSSEKAEGELAAPSAPAPEPPCPLPHIERRHSPEPKINAFQVAPFPVRKDRQRPRSLSPRRTPLPSIEAATTTAGLMPPVMTPYTIPPPATPLPFHIPTAADEGFWRPRAASTTSDSRSVRSSGGYSTMSVPTGAFYRPPKNPARAQQRHSMAIASNMAPTTTQSEPAAGMMATLSISATALMRPTASSSGFSLFRRMEPPIASSAAASRMFEPTRDLTYSTLQPLPKKVKSDEVMVQVFAAGLDRLDIERTKEMASRQDGFGFVPGRAFYGKVLDTGIEIKLVKRGDLVFGLMPMKKSSTLSEVITVPKDRVTIAPSASQLTVEQIASLPVTAVPALQAMETICDQLPRGSKILILNAHEGVGALSVQLADYLRPSKDLFVVAHCPITAYEGAEYCRAAGASHVIVDEPLATLNGLHESEFDVVIDTIGGRRLYDAARRVLHHTGTFISTVGDSASVSSTSQWKASLRSLRRTFVKKDKKLVRFLHVSSETVEQRDESVRAVLDRVSQAVIEGNVQPRVDRIWSFEDAASAFKDSSIAGPAQLGVGKVVRIKQV
ncbi:hypothetical protein OIV83_002392 [Microbotryomycetes sp. JL201]|nr:hypothetical protein OIV83_002392 [Microbotryomycetes sp. JL201]